MVLAGGKEKWVNDMVGRALDNEVIFGEDLFFFLLTDDEVGVLLEYGAGYR